MNNNLNNNETNDKENELMDNDINRSDVNNENINDNDAAIDNVEVEAKEEVNNYIADELGHTVIQDVEFNTADENPNKENINYYSETQEKNKKSKKEKIKKPRRKGSKGVIVAVALTCSILGGAIGTAVGYGLMKNSLNSAMDDIKNEISKNSSLGASSLSSISGINIPDIVDKISSAVVGVATKSTETNIFGFTMEGQEGLGSGVIFSEEGYVLTNYHVIKNSTQVKVIFSTGQEVEAKVVNYDEAADLAVVKITEDVKLPGVAELGNSDNLKAGEQVIAIGNPLGKEYLGSVTTGIISAVSRDVKSEDGTVMNLIQTDTAINSGNSGGPLINSQGQVIGINTAKIQATGVEGIGFAIPINDAIEKLDMLVKQKITLGITVIDVNEELSKQYNLPVGIFIKRVEDFSIAQKGGLQVGDVITKFGGEKVTTVAELNEIKSKFKDGDTMTVEFTRNGQTMTANLVAE